MDSPDVWRWVWLVAAFVFGVGEMATAGSFFLLPFAIGAAVAAFLAFLGVGVPWEWLAFLAVSAGGALVLVPFGRRLARNTEQHGIGSRRLIGEHGIVLEAIPAGPAHLGLVRVGREEWRAETADGSPVAAGSTVRVVDMRGTRLVVWPAGDGELTGP